MPADLPAVARMAGAFLSRAESTVRSNGTICAPASVTAGEFRSRVQPGPEHGTVAIMGTKAERRAARERVSTYHRAQLAELLTHVAAAIDRYRAGEIDAYAVDETIHHCHRAAGELWKFCFARGGGSHAEFIAGLLDRMTADTETIDWWERATPQPRQ